MRPEEVTVSENSFWGRSSRPVEATPLGESDEFGISLQLGTFTKYLHVAEEIEDRSRLAMCNPPYLASPMTTLLSFRYE